MPLRYFHLKNGVTTLDYGTVDLPDLAAVRVEALRAVAEILEEDDVEPLWCGVPLRLWVTDLAGGAGNTLLALDVVALASA